MKKKQSLSSLFDEICSFSEKYSRKKYAISVQEFEAKKVVRDLKAFSKQIYNELDEDVIEGFTMTCSYGMAYMPHIVWIAFLPVGEKVSRHMSVAICFGKTGEGAVCGLMESRGIRQSITQTFKRSKQKDNKINIDGGKTKNNYTDSFVNPIEILREELNSDTLVQHISSSIKILKELLEKNQH